MAYNFIDIGNFLEKELIKFLSQYDINVFVKNNLGEKPNTLELIVSFTKSTFDLYNSRNFNLFQAALSYLPQLLVPKVPYTIEVTNSEIRQNNGYYDITFFLLLREGISFVVNKTNLTNP